MTDQARLDVILVPQGAEYQAVSRGLQVGSSSLPVVAVPVGPDPITQFLQTWCISQQPQLRVLLLGLCGSLQPSYSAGCVVLYQGCLQRLGSSSDATQGQNVPWRRCDPQLTTELQQILGQQVSLGRALSSDRLVHRATEKRSLGQQYSAAVVDMEGFAALQVLQAAGMQVAMLRVVSDGCTADIPDLTKAFAADGSLQPVPLAWGMVRQPLAALRLVQGSLAGLQRLQQLTAQVVQAVSK